jgi:hypothetical protein
MILDSVAVGWQRERAWLGYAGLLPFLACAAILLLGTDPAQSRVAVDVMRFYAAVIASFLGAVHWGVAATDPTNRRARLRWGIMPALLAWTLLLLPPFYAFVGFAALFATILLVDWRLLPLLDGSYRQLRVQLSTIVITTLVIAAPVASKVTP